MLRRPGVFAGWPGLLSPFLRCSGSVARRLAAPRLVRFGSLLVSTPCSPHLHRPCPCEVLVLASLGAAAALTWARTCANAPNEAAAASLTSHSPDIGCDATMCQASAAVAAAIASFFWVSGLVVGMMWGRRTSSTTSTFSITSDADPQAFCTPGSLKGKGGKYHADPYCPPLARAKTGQVSVPLAVAAKRGLFPCKPCAVDG